MSELETDLKDWVAHGLISDDQARRIQTYSASKVGPDTAVGAATTSAKHSWVMSGLYILGALIIGIGMISLIASNWSAIPNFAKLGFDFLILVILALAAIRAERSHKYNEFEAWLVGLQMMVLASIGLISQVYNTGGKAHQALFFWSVITFGLAMVSKRIFVPFIWSGVVLLAFLLAGLESNAMKLFFAHNAERVAATLPLIAALIAGTLHRFGVTGGLQSAFRWWVLWAGLGVVVFFEFASGFDTLYATGNELRFAIGVLAALVGVDVLTSREFRKVQRGLLVTVLATFVFISLNAGDRLSVVRGAATIFILAAAAIFLASLHARGLFQFLISLIGIRFLVLYFQAFGGLATTGFGLILSGVFVIGTAIIWNKYRNRIAVWAERWTR